MGSRLTITTIVMLLSASTPLGAQTKPSVDVFWGLLGDYPEETHLNPYKLTRDDPAVDSAAILYAIRRDPKSIDQIVQETRIPAGTVQAKLEELARCDLIAVRENGYVVNFPFWDAALRDEINRLGSELADRVSEVIVSELLRLKATMAKSSLTLQGYEWDDVSLIIVGGFLLDTGLNDRGLRSWGVFQKKRDTPVRPGNYRYWYKAVENGWGPFWKFGHNLIHGDNRSTWFGMFYGSIPGRRIQWEKHVEVHDLATRAIVLPLIREPGLGENELWRLSGLSRPQFDAAVAKMKQARIISIERQRVFPEFPILAQDDVDTLLAEVDTICDRIINDIFVPFLPEIERRWAAVEPASWSIEGVERFFIREVFDRNYNLTIDKLIRDGVLPPSPVEPPFDYWGMRARFELL